MSVELSKTYDPAAVESRAYEVWLKEGCFTADPAAGGEPYCIVIPPPNVTGALHLGHAINDTLQDILIRQHRMAGFNTLWVPGIDHAGIATQAMVEKQLKEQENKTRHDVGREGLVERIWKWKQQFGDRILEQLKRLGCSCDWSRTHFTLDEQCATAVRETFFKLFKDGLIYRGKRLVNWDVHLQTSISDDEIYHETVKTSLWHIRYRIVDVAGSGQQAAGSREGSSSLPTASRQPPASFMTVATTRPETLLGDTAVAVHSQDARWNWAIGKFVELPLTGRRIPIIADDILVDPKFGSGVVKVTPAHDPNDYAVWQRQAGKIEILNILNPSGTLNENAGPAYAGMKRDAARKKVVEDLVAAGLLEKEEPYETQVGHSDRSKTPVEPYLSDQWFVHMAPLAEPALQVVREGIIKFFPERHAQQYLSWLGEKRDWPISRQLWWGHRIPVWSKTILVDERGSGQCLDEAGFFVAGLDHILDVPQPNSAIVIDADGRIIRSGEGRGSLRDIRGTLTVYVCSTHLATIKNIEQEGFVQDPDVLDTWFSSALWPHSTLGWPDQTDDLKKWYPTSVLLTGRDIITLWVARMVMMGMYNMGEAAGSGRPAAGGATEKLTPSPGTPGEGGGEGSSPSPGTPAFGSEAQARRGEGRSGDSQELNATLNAQRSTLNVEVGKRLGIPFFHVAINPTILDGKGERMSKSKGNGVDPVDIIDTHGADALRFTLTSMATETQDVRLPVKRDAQGRNTSDRFDVGRNFCNKLWNAARFALGNLQMAGGGQRAAGSKEHAELAAGCQPPAASFALADRWIISRFNRSVEEANAAIAIYRFDQYAKVCYDFFWRDFCDWYVEAIKPTLRSAAAGKSKTVLAAVLDGALRLMHPMIPFITETIWWQLNEVCPNRGLVGILDCPPRQRLIRAAWPMAGNVDEKVEGAFARVQEIIAAIRNVRNEAKVDAKKTVNVRIEPMGEEIHQNRELIESLAMCRVGGPSQTGGETIRVAAGGCDIFVEGIERRAVEDDSQAKQCAALRQRAEALRGRLANPAYTGKAPPHLVQQTRDELAGVEAEMGKLGCV